MIDDVNCSSAALFGTVNVDLGFDDRHQSGGQNLPGHRELLIDHRVDSRARSGDQRAHLGAEDAFVDRAGQRASRPGIGFITCAPFCSAASRSPP